MLIHSYIRKGIVYIPTVARTTVRYYMNIEPIEVFPISDLDAFTAAIKQAIRRGNPTVATPTRTTGFPKPAILKYANVGSSAAFEEGSASWHLEERGGIYRITPMKNHPEGGWREDLERVESMPLKTTVDDAVRYFIARVREPRAGGTVS